jgi:hypothetical protein
MVFTSVGTNKKPIFFGWSNSLKPDTKPYTVDVSRPNGQRNGHTDPTIARKLNLKG